MPANTIYVAHTPKKNIEIEDSPYFWRNLIGISYVLLSVTNNNMNIRAFLFVIGMGLLLTNWILEIIKN